MGRMGGRVQGHEEMFGVMDVFIILIVVMVIWCVRRLKHEMICFKYVVFIVFQLYPNRPVCSRLFIKKQVNSTGKSSRSGICVFSSIFHKPVRGLGMQTVASNHLITLISTRHTSVERNALSKDVCLCLLADGEIVIS